MNTYETYGFETSELVALKVTLENALAIDFDKHDSEFYGEYYLAKLDSGESYKLYLNKIDGDYHEDAHPKCEILLDISSPVKVGGFIKTNNKYDIGGVALNRCEIEGGIAKNYRFQDGVAILVAEKNLS